MALPRIMPGNLIVNGQSVPGVVEISISDGAGKRGTGMNDEHLIRLSYPLPGESHRWQGNLPCPHCAQKMKILVMHDGFLLASIAGDCSVKVYNGISASRYFRHQWVQEYHQQKTRGQITCLECGKEILFHVPLGASAFSASPSKRRARAPRLFMCPDCIGLRSLQGTPCSRCEGRGEVPAVPVEGGGFVSEPRKLPRRRIYVP